MNSPSNDVVDNDLHLKKPIYVIGKELNTNEYSIHNKLTNICNLRSKLMDSTIYSCQLCSNLQKHVYFEIFK